MFFTSRNAPLKERTARGEALVTHEPPTCRVSRTHCSRHLPLAARTIQYRIQPSLPVLTAVPAHTSPVQAWSTPVQYCRSAKDVTPPVPCTPRHSCKGSSPAPLYSCIPPARSPSNSKQAGRGGSGEAGDRFEEPAGAGMPVEDGAGDRRQAAVNKRCLEPLSRWRLTISNAPRIKVELQEYKFSGYI